MTDNNVFLKINDHVADTMNMSITQIIIHSSWTFSKLHKINKLTNYFKVANS